MAEMIALVDEPGAEPFAYGARPFYRVVAMESMAGDAPQPAPRAYGSWAAAKADAVAWTGSAPWTRHAQVWAYFPGYTPGWVWYERDPETREVVDWERRPGRRIPGERSY